MKQESKKTLRRKIIKYVNIKHKRIRSSFDFTKLAEALESAESDAVGETTTLVNVHSSGDSTIVDKSEGKTEKNSAYDFSKLREELFATRNKETESLKALTAVAAAHEKRKITRRVELLRRFPSIPRRRPASPETSLRKLALGTDYWLENPDLVKYCLDLV